VKVVQMGKAINYGDVFLSDYTKRRIRKMRAELRAEHVKEYIIRNEKGLPLFKKEEDTNE
jgi:hypothetical protein